MTGDRHTRGDGHHGDGSTTTGDRRLRWYPPAWRARYGSELCALLDDEYAGLLPAKVRLGLITGGLRERARQSGLTGDSAPAEDRLRAGALVAFGAWVAFVVAGASFAKFSEHFDQALPHNAGAHRLADVAFSLLQAVAAVTGLLVVAGALIAMPAFSRLLRASGWSSLRGHLLRAIACTAVALGVTVALVVSGHHLAPVQRNGGVRWYGVLFLGWALLVAATLALWGVVAVAAAMRVTLSAAVLRVEAGLAFAVTGAMAVMLGATALWWAAMASHAPAFLSASPAGAQRSPWDAWLVGTVALMSLATAGAIAGSTRAACNWTKRRV